MNQADIDNSIKVTKKTLDIIREDYAELINAKARLESQVEDLLDRLVAAERKLESPFAGDVDANTAYAREAVAESLARIASLRNVDTPWGDS
jgi:cell division septum initiation protein DivIVA